MSRSDVKITAVVPRPDGLSDITDASAHGAQLTSTSQESATPVNATDSEDVAGGDHGPGSASTPGGQGAVDFAVSQAASSAGEDRGIDRPRGGWLLRRVPKVMDSLVELC